MDLPLESNPGSLYTKNRNCDENGDFKLSGEEEICACRNHYSVLIIVHYNAIIMYAKGGVFCAADQADY